jgi:hypothetical protein
MATSENQIQDSNSFMESEFFHSLGLGPTNGVTNPPQHQEEQKLCKRRAAIEPIIGHLKSDFRLSRNLLKGQVAIETLLPYSYCLWSLPLAMTYTSGSCNE